MTKDKYKLIDNEKIKERFLKKVDCSEKYTECHIWLASKNKTGHGMFSVMGQTIPASRYAFMMYGKFSSISGMRGDLASSEVVTQTCFNPSCVNPKHLEVSNKRKIGKRLTIHPDQLIAGSINFLNRLKKERPDLANKIENQISEINNPPTEVNFGDIDPFSNTIS